MKATGIVRRVDDLGRIVIPKEIRRTLKIREGDPLEIYTEKDGGVIFRKYSPMGDLQEFAAQMCESIGSATGHIAAVSDRDSIIALYGAPKRELMDKPNSPDLEKLMEQRKNYLFQPGDTPIRASDGAEKYHLGAASPILSQGDRMGCVLLLLGEGDNPLQEADQCLTRTAAGFMLEVTYVIVCRAAIYCMEKHIGRRHNTVFQDNIFNIVNFLPIPRS